MIGLGRMGGNMARRLMRGGHEIVGYSPDADSVKQLASEGASGARSLEEAVASLPAPRTVWVMVPAGDATEQVVSDLGGLLSQGDVVIDGGNTWFKDDVRRAAVLKKKGIHYVDVGTSGGVWGLERGYCCLLYTSPSPRDATLSRMPSSA